MNGLDFVGRVFAVRGRKAVAGAAAVVVLMAGGALAQDNSAEGAKIWMNKAGCPFCHGWAGDGKGDAHSEGKAPSLRITQLTRDQIRMTVQCGRPGTAMPHFDKFAYTDKRCYGQTADELGPQTPDVAPTTLQAPEIDAIADYVANKLKGAGPVTNQECVAYFGPSAQLCNEYPKAQAALDAPAATVAAK